MNRGQRRRLEGAYTRYQGGSWANELVVAMAIGSSNSHVRHSDSEVRVEWRGSGDCR